MHTTYITLAELNANLAVCSVTVAQLQQLGFEPVGKTILKKEDFTEAQWKSFRSAKLYQRAQLPEIRASIAEPLQAA